MANDSVERFAGSRAAAAGLRRRTGIRSAPARGCRRFPQSDLSATHAPAGRAMLRSSCCRCASRSSAPGLSSSVLPLVASKRQPVMSQAGVTGLPIMRYTGPIVFWNVGRDRQRLARVMNDLRKQNNEQQPGGRGHTVFRRLPSSMPVLVLVKAGLHAGSARPQRALLPGVRAVQVMMDRLTFHDDGFHQRVGLFTRRAALESIGVHFSSAGLTSASAEYHPRLETCFCTMVDVNPSSSSTAIARRS